MTLEKVTRNDLRSIPMGATREFDLPNAKACDTAKTVAYQLQNQEGCRFSVETDYLNSRIKITKNAL